MRIAIALHKLGISSDMLHGFGFASVAGALSLWGRSASAGRGQRARAERLAIFVGLWPPTLFLLGKVLQDVEAAPEEQADRARRAKNGSLDEALAAAA